MVYENSAEANLLRWTPGMLNCYEIYYLTLNHLRSRTGYWIRYTLHAPADGLGDPYAEVWFAFYDLTNPDDGFGLAEKYPIDALASSIVPFSVRIGDSVLTNEACQGAVGGAGHAAAWDLRFEPCAKPFLHFPESLYESGDVESAMLSPHFSTSFSGTIEVDGRRIDLTGDPGEQSHTWGRQHPPHWLWCHCNHFTEDPNAAMELVCALPEEGHPASLEAHVLYAKVGGREHRLLSLADGSRSESTASPGSWRLEAEGETVRIEADIRCRPVDLIPTARRLTASQPRWRRPRSGCPLGPKSPRRGRRWCRCTRTAPPTPSGGTSSPTRRWSERSWSSPEVVIGHAVEGSSSNSSCNAVGRMSSASTTDTAATATHTAHAVS
jgi:hypothetical protein